MRADLLCSVQLDARRLPVNVRAVLEDELLVSHDVVSLFTSTPVKESLEVIRERLQCHPKWGYTTLLEVDDIMELS